MEVIAELLIRSIQSSCKLWAVSKLLLYFLSQAPLFEMDQEEDEEEDVLSVKSRGKKQQQDFVTLCMYCLTIAPIPINYSHYSAEYVVFKYRKLIINSWVNDKVVTVTTRSVCPAPPSHCWRHGHKDSDSF